MSIMYYSTKCQFLYICQTVSTTMSLTLLKMSKEIEDMSLTSQPNSLNKHAKKFAYN